MDHKLFKYLGSIIIFTIWLFVAITAIKEYIRLIKTQGLRVFITKKEIDEIKDPNLTAAISTWRRIIKRLFLFWVTSGFIYILISIIIDHTIGFRNI